MPQQYGLGRGLSSLIPPKKTAGDGSGVSSPFVIRPVQQSRNTDDSQTSTVKSPATITSPALSVPSSSVPTKNASEPAPFSKDEPVSSEPAALEPGSATKIPITSLAPNPHQPRVQFDESKLKELSASIKEHGILQPLVVTKTESGYELIAGERRLQAAKLAGLTEVPVVVRVAGDQEKLELAIIENIQRHNLNPIEEAKAYLRLIEEFGLHQEAVAQKMGKSRSAVANTVRLLHLPIEIQRAVIEGKISEGHARALLSIENPEKQRALFDMIVKSSLTVREAELQARSVSLKPPTRRTTNLSPDIAERVEKLREHLGTKVKIAPVGTGGKIVIEYYSSEELTGLLGKFGI